MNWETKQGYCEQVKPELTGTVKKTSNDDMTKPEVTTSFDFWICAYPTLRKFEIHSISRQCMSHFIPLSSDKNKFGKMTYSSSNLLPST